MVNPKNTPPFDLSDGEAACDEFEALNNRVAKAITQAPWLALRPSDHDTVQLALKYLRLTAVLLELLRSPEMALLPNEFHPSARCSCRQCLEQYK